MSWDGKEGVPGKTETMRDVLRRQIKKKSGSTRYNFPEERFESILLKHLSEGESWL